MSREIGLIHILRCLMKQTQIVRELGKFLIDEVFTKALNRFYGL